MDKKRLLIFHPVIAPYRIDFFNSLYDAFEIKVCLTLGDEDTFDYKKIYSQLLFKPYFLNGWIKIKNRIISKEYWKQIDEFDPDIILVSEFGFGTILVLLYKLLKRQKFRVVSICDDSYNMLADNNDFSRGHKLARKLIPYILDDIIVVEPIVEKWYQDKFNKGIFFPIIRDANKQREVFQRVLENSLDIMHNMQMEDKNIFLYVGRFLALKNIETIIKAFSSLNQKENVLVLVGSGEEEIKLKNFASQLNCNVIFTGRLEGDALYAWYNVADYFVLASYQEAFGAVTNEALLAGCYCLISSKAGSRCLIEEGKNGYTFSPMDACELTERMKQVIREFPKKRPLNRVKTNLMIINYQEKMSNLIEHLKSL